MAENPLLPHRRLQELHAFMLRCRDLERKHRAATGISREALLSAAAIQMEAGDVLCGEPDDRTVVALAASIAQIGKRKSRSPQEPALPSWPEARLTAYAGIAHGLQSTLKQRAVVALVSTAAGDSDWPSALSYAQSAKLPFVLLCADLISSKRASAVRESLSWPAINKLAGSINLPVLSVDGEDAVAVYRVVQESLNRVRLGDGPVVIWCSFFAGTQTTRRDTPLRTMERYLAVRGIKPLKVRRKPKV